MLVETTRLDILLLTESEAIMKHMPSDEHEVTLTHVPPIRVPPYVPPTKAELDRRRKLIAEIDQIRASFGPISANVVDLIDQDYIDADAAER